MIKNQQKNESPSFGNVCTAEAIIMFLTAAIIDYLGIYCLLLDPFALIGEIPSYFLDVVGFLIFGSWILFRSLFKKQFTETTFKMAGPVKEMVQRGKKTFARGTKRGIKVAARFGLSTLGEILPVLGNLLPCWTLFVISEIKSD